MAIAFRAASTVTTTTAATTIVASPPAGITTNDVMIAIVSGYNGVGSQTISTPTGWTKIGSTVNDTTAGIAGAVFYKVAVSGESGNTYTFTFGTASDGNVIIGAYSGASTTSPINVNSAGAHGATNGSGQWTGVSVTTTVANCQVLQCVSTANGTSYTMPSGWTQRSVNVNANGAQNLLADEPLASAGASGTPTWTENAASDEFLQWTVGLAPATGGVTQTVASNSISSSEGFEQPTVILGAVVSSNSIGGSEGWGQPTLILGAVVSANSIGSSEGFGQPSVKNLNTITPNSIDGSEGFGQPAVNNLNTITPNSIASTEGWGQPTVILGAVVSSNSISSSEGWGQPTVILGAVVAANSIGSSEGFGQPSITNLNTISPNSIGSSEGFGQPALNATATIAPNSIGSSEGWGQPTIAQGAITVSPNSIASAEGFGQPVVSASATLAPNSVGSNEGFGLPTVSAVYTVSVNSIGSSEGWGQPSIATVATIQPASIDGSEGFGLPGVSGSGAVTIFANPIASSEAWGSPLVIQPVVAGNTGGKDPYNFKQTIARHKKRVVYVYKGQEYSSLARLREVWQRETPQQEDGQQEAPQQEGRLKASQSTQAKARRRVGKDTGLVFDAYQERHRQDARHIPEPKDHIEQFYNELIRVQMDLNHALALVEAHKQAEIKRQRDAEIGALLIVAWQEQLRADDEEALKVILAATDDAFLTLLGN